MADVFINQDEFNKFVNKILNEIAAEARLLAPIGQGDLRGSINVVGSKILINPVDINGKSYAAAVEYGRAPGHKRPPFGPGSRLSVWAGTPGRATRQLAQIIADRGIRAKPFFFPAVKKVAERHFINVRVR